MTEQGRCYRPLRVGDEFLRLGGLPGEPAQLSSEVLVFPDWPVYSTAQIVEMLLNQLSNSCGLWHSLLKQT